MSLEIGDRVMFVTGEEPQLAGKLGIVDSEVFETARGDMIYVKTRHGLFCSSQSAMVKDLEKVEDYKITVEEFLWDMQGYLINKRIDAGDSKEGELCTDILKQMKKLRAHIGY